MAGGGCYDVYGLSVVDSLSGLRCQRCDACARLATGMLRLYVYSLHAQTVLLCTLCAIIVECLHIQTA
jgi:hypothetical protein